MLNRSLLACSVVGILLWLCEEAASKRNWEYEPLSMDVYTSDESKVSLEASVERVGRGEYAITATLYVNFDMDETTMVEAVAYRSSSGSEDDYKLLPWSVPLQPFQKFVNEYYEKLVYKNFATCANIPEPENAFPWPKGTNKFEKCIASGDGMPEIAPEGYYKIYFNVSGQVEMGFKAIAKVTTKNDYIG